MDRPPDDSIIVPPRVLWPYMGSSTIWSIQDEEWTSLWRPTTPRDAGISGGDTTPDAAWDPDVRNVRAIFRDAEPSPCDPLLTHVPFQCPELERGGLDGVGTAVARPNTDAEPVEVLELPCQLDLELRRSSALSGTSWAAVAGNKAVRRNVPPLPRAPPILTKSAKENLQPMQLFRLYKGTLPPRSAFKPILTNAWESKPDPSIQEVPSSGSNPVAGRPWLTLKTAGESSTGMDTTILRVVSFDEEEGDGCPLDLFKIATKGKGGVEYNDSNDGERQDFVDKVGTNTVSFQQVSPDDDQAKNAVQQVNPEEEHMDRKLPEPRRLDFVGKPNHLILEAVAIYDIVPIKGVPVTGADFAQLLGAIAEDSRRPDAAERAELVLRHMLSEYKDGRSSVRPDGGMYNKVMHAYADRGDPEKVEELLRLMCREYDSGDKIAEPNVKHYTTLLYAWQKSGSIHAPVRCEAILTEMHKLDESGGLSKCKPDKFTYTSVLHCWADSDRKDAALRAETLFRTMKDKYDQGDKGMRPDNISYSNLINVYAKSNGFARAEEILWEMVDEFLKGNDSCKPKIRNLNTILAVWSKSTVPYAPERVEDLVRRWQRLVKTTKLDVPPDNYTYCLFLKCWAISTRPDAPDRMMQAMEWMGDLAINGDAAARLDQVKIGTCITSWINSRSFRHAADFLEVTCNNYFRGSVTTIPDYQYFNKTVRSLCSVNNVSRADDIIRVLWSVKCRERLASHDTTALVRFVIFEWIRLERPDRAEDLLLQMDDHHQKGKIREYPDAHTFQLVIAAWKKSRFHDKYERVDKLQKLQQSRQNTTNRRTFFRK